MTTDFTTYDTSTPIAEDDRDLPPGHPLRTAVGRTLSDIYTFWSLCNIAKCRRAGRCAGDPQHCLDAFLPLISDAVHEEGQRVFEAKIERLSFDELLARCPDGLPSLWCWNIALTNRHGAPLPRVEAASRDWAIVPSPCSPLPATAAPRRRRPRS